MKKSQFGKKVFWISGGRYSGKQSTDLWLECARLGIAERPDIRTALQELSFNPSAEECRAYVEQSLNSLAIREILNPEPYRRTNPSQFSNVFGPIVLGKVRHSEILWGIDQNALTEHMVCVGRTGGGKTTLIKRILSEILRRKSK